MQAPALQMPPSQDVEPQEPGSQDPCAQRYPAGQATPKQSGVTQLPSKQTSLAAQGVLPQVVGWQAPAAQRFPSGQVTPRQEVETQSPLEHTASGGHCWSAQLVS